MRTSQIIVGPLPPPVGGVSSAVINLARLLESKKHGVLLFSNSGGNDREDLYKRKAFFSYLKNFMLFFKYIHFLFLNSKTVVCHVFVVSNSAFIRDFIFILISKIFRKKVIVHFHSKIKGELFLSKKTLKYLAFGLGFSDVVLVLSHDHLRYFSKVLNPNKTKVLENFVFSVDYPKCNLNSTDYLYVGRLTEKKGFYDLVNAIDLCVNKYLISDIRVHCLGLSESEKLELEILELIKMKNLNNHILMHGVVTGDDKYKYFNKAPCFLFPSHFENSPVVLKEAIASNLPVIASNINANKNILKRSNNAIFFELNNSEDLALKIMDIYSNYDLRLELSKNAELSFKYDENYAYSVISSVVDDVILNKM